MHQKKYFYLFRTKMFIDKLWQFKRAINLDLI